MDTYKHYNISIDWSVFKSTFPDTGLEDVSLGAIESMNISDVRESELITAKQQTLMWNEEQCLDIAPGEDRTPESHISDKFAEELSFPGIYFGVARQINANNGARSSAYTMCMSETRGRDRRGATPQHVLYMAMKILRLRVRDSIQSMYRCLRTTERITREMIENREFVERLIDTNQAFLKTMPNSVQYWAARKKDLFAMIRQLGKPTAFLTISAKETHWPNLLRILHGLSEGYNDIEIHEMEDVVEKLDEGKRAHLVAEDPATCAIYFHKLVNAILTIISAKKTYKPFGEYRVIEYFLRIEFQHRGSPHAHILLWLENDPAEEISDSMPNTVNMISDLCSVDKANMSDPTMIKNQTHAHTFTRTKRDCDHQRYQDLIRLSLKRPTLLFKRDMTQIFVNTFNPWISSVLNSNMDLQIILDPYSCAAYVVDYVNKSNRGKSHLHREFTSIHEANPEYDQTQLMTKVGLKVLNRVEMSAQEAALYLLRQPMSWASQATVMIRVKNSRSMLSVAAFNKEPRHSFHSKNIYFFALEITLKNGSL
ncbi:uncharacterized protein LOC114828168 [Galendromus occidentalis]|uniref:Uncharacterized protein LOC114828168 n=1 Tax=Galendromus occidentalis TaxID=34638 RepID=A0AAJ7SF75_9ACAR|nr:uncharacterized protein LOC114828168 [Galendromus occidentalis]